jgi:hypothetical protein
MKNRLVSIIETNNKLNRIRMVEHHSIENHKEKAIMREKNLFLKLKKFLHMYPCDFWIELIRRKNF